MVGIEALLHHYPDAVKLKDKMGRLTLALACRNTDFNEEILALLVRDSRRSNVIPNATINGVKIFSHFFSSLLRIGDV